MICISRAASVPVSEAADQNVIWFPDPSTEAEDKYIPAYLNPSAPAVPTDISKIHFLLYTKANPNDPDELFIGDVEGFQRSHFRSDAKLMVLVHGFGGGVGHTFPWETKNRKLVP